MNAAQKRLTQIDVLRRHVLNYARTREVFQQYKASGYSKKFLNEHQQEIDRHRAAKRAFNELGLQKLPSKKWNTVSCLRRKKRLTRRTATRGNRRGNCSRTGKICGRILPRRRLRQERSDRSRTRDNRPAYKHRRRAAIRMCFGAWGGYSPTSEARKRHVPFPRVLQVCINTCPACRLLIACKAGVLIIWKNSGSNHLEYRPHKMDDFFQTVFHIGFQKGTDNVIMNIVFRMRRRRRQMLLCRSFLKKNCLYCATRAEVSIRAL